MEDEMSPSPLAELDRRIEDAVGRIMNGVGDASDYGLVSDLSARRVEISEPAAFARLDAILTDLERHAERLSGVLDHRLAAE